MTISCHYIHEYLPDQYKNVCIVGTHHIGEPTGQMVNCGGWEKDEHGRFSEKANPEINCELIIGAPCCSAFGRGSWRLRCFQDGRHSLLVCYNMSANSQL